VRRHSGINTSPVVGKVNSIRIPANENLERDVPEIMSITTSSALRAFQKRLVRRCARHSTTPAGVFYWACGISQRNCPG
jgi:hypothetical protein